MKKFLFIGLFLAGLILRAQTQITLRVIDAMDNEPVIGAIIEQNEKILARTDNEGKAVISVQPGSVLTIRFTGYETQTVQVPETVPQVWEIKLVPVSVQLDQVVIESDPLRTPVHAIVSTDLEKKYSQPRNTAELFKDIPGFTLQKRSAMSTEPSLRAFKYEEMNLIYDGGYKMVNACPNRMDPAPAHVIPEEVEKIEVIKGPFNVRFGQTFGAVVNMITRPSAPKKMGWSGLFQGGYEFNGGNTVGLGSITYAEEKFDITSVVSYRDFGDYVDGKGDTVPAGFKSLEYSLKTGWNPTKNQRIQLDWRQNFTRDVKHPGLPMDSPKDDSYLIGLDYLIKDVSDKINAITSKAYYSFVDHLMTNGYLMDEPRPNYPTFDARTPVWSRTLGGKIEAEYQPAENTLIYIGTDADAIARDGIKKVVINNNPMTGEPWTPKVKVLKVWQNSQINDFGFYAQGSRTKDRKHIFGAGLRGDLVWSIAKDPDPGMIAIYGNFGPRTDIVFSGNFSYTYKQSDYRMEAAIGRGTRTPNMIERYIYRFAISEDTRDYIGNPYLKPEVNNQIEISAIKKWGNFHAGIDVYASYFQNYITAKINSALTSTSGGCGGGPPRAPKQFVNVDAYQYGADLYAGYRINEHLKISADYSYIKAYNLTFNEPLAQVNPPGGHLKMEYKKDKYWIDYRMEWREPKTEVSLTFDERPTPGYTVHDLLAGIKFDKHASLGISITNIFDTPYYFHTTFVYRNYGDKTGQPIYEPGRNIGFMFTYKF